MSGAINPYGAPARVVEAVLGGRVIAVASCQLLDELAEVLARSKFRRWIALADAAAFVEALRGHADVLPDVEAPPRRLRDPGDDYLVALAEAADAAIVSGDADLSDADITPEVLTPRALLERLG